VSLFVVRHSNCKSIKENW